MQVVMTTPQQSSFSFKEEFRSRLVAFSSCSCESFYKLQWSRDVRYYFFYRTFTILYTWAWLVVDFVHNTDPHYLSYLTNWSQINMVAYFTSSFILLVAHVTRKKNTSHPTSHTTSPQYDSEQNQVHMATVDGAEASTNVVGSPNHRLRFYHVIVWILLNTYVTIAFGVTLIYWVGASQNLVGGTTSIISVNIHVHGINSVLACIELLSIDLPVRIMHFYQPVLFGVAYTITNLSLHWSDTISDVYSILDWENHSANAIAFTIGILVVAIPLLHFISYCFYRIRLMLFLYFVKRKPSVEIATNAV
ncbi:protein rolling stone-like [Ciona intestinalis]